MSRSLSRLRATLFPARSHPAAPVSVSPVSVSPLDLLGRRAVNLDTPELQRFIGGKRIMVTGAGGSIGSEICRQAMKFCPASLVLVERCENALFEIDQELRDRWIGADVRPVMADICDAPRIAQVMAAERPHVVFHAAAHKHVTMMEKHPGEAVKNNVFGTKTIADASRDAGVTAFVMISSDKAVNPTSVMGATKRVAELYIQSLNETGSGFRASGSGPFLPETRDPEPGTRFTAVRFGNVLGSSGSVIPIFQRQIAAGGPITVTHPEMRRYFMTIPEASQLVMQAGAIGAGGEIFILDMGEPVKIVDLAHELLKRHGLVAGRDIELRFTGMRAGEKLFEELANDSDAIVPTGHAKIQVWKLPRQSASETDAMLATLGAVIESPAADVVAALTEVVPEYRPAQLPAAKDVRWSTSVPMVEAA